VARSWWCAVVENYEGFTIIVSEPHQFADSWSMKISVQESISPEESGMQNVPRPAITFSFGGYFPTKEIASTRALVAAHKLIGELASMSRF
jgi:hypothetical protein